MSTKFNRRSILGGMIGGAVGLALAPRALATIADIGPHEGVVRLTSNENPYGPSAKALQAAQRAAAKGAYYPGAVYRQFYDLISSRNGVAPENIILSSGSNEGLCAALVAWGKQGETPALEDGSAEVITITGQRVRRDPQSDSIAITAFGQEELDNLGEPTMCHLRR